MPTRSKRTLTQRIALDGGREIRRELQALGDEGKEAFEALRRTAGLASQASTGLNGRLLELRNRFKVVGQEANRLRERFSFLGSDIGRLAGVVIGAFSLREISRISDEYVELTNILRVVAGEQGNVNQTVEALGQIANRTRTPLEAIATLYQRASIAGKELNATQGEILQFTQNVGLALAQQGGSAEQARGALLQLSQALGAGTVRAEEFNSILEGAFPIAQAAARGLDEAGGSVARLRQLILEGSVTSEQFFRALLSQSEALEEAFARTTPTISQAFTVLRNNLTLLVGQTNEATGITAFIANVLLFLADNLEIVAASALTVAAAFAIVKGVALAGDIIALTRALFALIPALVSVGAALVANPITLWAALIAAAAVAVLALTGNLDDFVNAIQETVSPVFDAVGAMLGLKEGSEDALDQILNGETGAPAAASSISGITEANESLLSSLKETGDEGEQAFQKIGRGVQQLQDNMEGLLVRLNSNSEKAQELYQNLERVGGSQGSFQTLNDTSAGSIVRLRSGGGISGPGSGTSDSILARVSNGEWVIRAAAVRKYGHSFMSAINGMKLPAFNTGGLVSGIGEAMSGISLPSLPSLSSGSGGASGRPLTLNIGGEMFEGLFAPEDVAGRLATYASGRMVRRAGKVPSWYRN